jgi:hypothetical protein
MNTFTFENIIELIKEVKYPFLFLSYKPSQFSSPIFVNSFQCQGFEKEADIEAKINAGVQWLQNQVRFFPSTPEGCFQIIMKTSEKANATGISGPFLFSMNGNKPTEALNGIPQPQQFSGLGIPAGYVPETSVKAAQLEAELNFERKINDLQRQHEKEKFDLTIQQIKDEFNEKIETAASNKLTPETLNGLLDKGMALYGMMSGKAMPATLAGTQEPEQKNDFFTDEIISEMSEFSTEQKAQIAKMVKSYKQAANGKQCTEQPA